MANIATADYILVGAKEFYNLITELPMHLSELRGITEAVEENYIMRNLMKTSTHTACDELFN